MVLVYLLGDSDAVADLVPNPSSLNPQSNSDLLTASRSADAEFNWVRLPDPFESNHALEVVVKVELVRNGPQVHLGQLVLALVADPGVDDVLGEHVAAQQPLVVGFEVIEHFA